MSAGVFLIIGAILGWFLRSAFDRAVVSVMLRLLASGVGKKRVLEALQQGIAKL